MHGLTWVLALVSEALCKLLSPAKHVWIDRHPWTNMGTCPGERVPLEITITHEACMDGPTCNQCWLRGTKTFLSFLDRQLPANWTLSLSLPWKQASLATNLISFESRSLHTSWAPASWSIKPQEAQTNKQTRFHVSVQDRDTPFLSFKPNPTTTKTLIRRGKKTIGGPPPLNPNKGDSSGYCGILKPFLMGAGQGFCFQFCDVAKLAIIHKKIQ
jgi:hypothetical protein